MECTLSVLGIKRQRDHLACLEINLTFSHLKRHLVQVSIILQAAESVHHLSPLAISFPVLATAVAARDELSSER